MDSKQLRRVEIKDADRGEVTAVFATFNVIDADGDVTLPGAFADNGPMPISAYQHGSWNGALPVGKGTIRETSIEAILEGQFFMDTTQGRDTFRTVKALAEDGLGEWSYGYEPAKYAFGEFDGQDVRFLEKQKVFEVSPVLRGAGLNTRTLTAKGAGLAASEWNAAIRPHQTKATAEPWDQAGAVAGIPAGASVSDLRSVYAWASPDGDPESKGSYLYAHHHGVGGPANIRALLVGVAKLNGAADGPGVPEADRRRVYEHLAKHLRDADREPPQLAAVPGGTLRLNEEVAAYLAGLDALLGSASRVVALRAEKGKTLSGVNVEILGWLDEDLRKLRSLLDSPKTQIHYEHARAIGNLWLNA